MRYRKQVFNLLPKPSRAGILIAGLLVAAGCLGMSLVGLALSWKDLGYNRGQVLGREYLTLAQYEWRNGHFYTAVQRARYGIWALVDSEIRWQIAQPYVRAFEVFRRDGRDQDALQACQRALKYLQLYESEGGIATDCYTLERQLTLPANTPNQPTEP